MKQRYVARPGRAVTASTRRPTRRAITAAEHDDWDWDWDNITGDQLKQLLEERGIDVTPHRYLYTYSDEDRFDTGSGLVREKFKAPGDYVAMLTLYNNRMPVTSFDEAVETMYYYAGGPKEFFDDVGDSLPAICDNSDGFDNYYATIERLDSDEIVWTQND